MNGVGKDNKKVHLNSDDLILLLESYKNQIELNTTLLEQQKRISDQIESLLTSQKTLCDSLHSMIETLNKQRIDCVKEHAGLRHWIYVSLVGTGVIVVSLIALTSEAFEKFDVIKAIAKHLGVW